MKKSLIAVSLLAVLPAIVLAQQQQSFVKITGTQDIVAILFKLLDVMLFVAIPVVAIIVIVGGYYMFGSNEENIQTGRKMVLWAAIGFAVILLAKGVTFLVGEIVSRGAGGGGTGIYGAPPTGGGTYTPGPTEEERQNY